MSRDEWLEVGAPALSALAIVFLVFHLTEWNGPFGFVVCWFLGFVTIYGILVRQRHGAVTAKDKLATVAHPRRRGARADPAVPDLLLRAHQGAAGAVRQRSRTS